MSFILDLASPTTHLGCKASREHTCIGSDYYVYII